MKILQVFVLIFGLTIFANAQKAILSGRVYDANGSIITEAKITAKNEKGEIFEVTTNGEGKYTLTLPYNPYRATDDFKIAKYVITVSRTNFEESTIKDFKLVSGEMNLDFALDVFVNINTITIGQND